MPAIKVYKHDGDLPGLIPVEEAKTAKAYRCPFTGTIIQTKRSYVKHLKSLRQDRMWKKARARKFRLRLEDLWNQPDFESVVKWVTVNSDVFWQLGLQNGFHTDQTRWKKIRDDFQIEITSLKLAWDESVSNTHSFPHNGETNWGGNKPDVPRGYPGWRGRIEFRTSHDYPSFSSNLLKGSRIHIGTGGGSDNLTFSYDVKLFDADWPVLSKRYQEQEDSYEREHLIDMIKNQYIPYRRPQVSIS